jgi:3-methyladenine DNA glycosylase/8-oxoguanine DNA glycosylase
MSTEMTSSEDDKDDLTRTTIEVDEAVWRRVRSEAIREDKKVSEQLEAILREHFDIDEDGDK